MNNEIISTNGNKSSTLSTSYHVWQRIPVRCEYCGVNIKEYEFEECRKCNNVNVYICDDCYIKRNFWVICKKCILTCDHCVETGIFKFPK